MRRAKDSLEDRCSAGQRRVGITEAPGGHVHLTEVAQSQAYLVVVRPEYFLECRQHPAQRLARFCVTASRVEKSRKRSTVGSRFEVVSPHAPDGCRAR